MRMITDYEHTKSSTHWVDLLVNVSFICFRFFSSVFLVLAYWEDVFTFFHTQFLEMFPPDDDFLDVTVVDEDDYKL